MLGLLTLNLEMVLKFSKKSIGDREVGSEGWKAGWTFSYAEGKVSRSTEVQKPVFSQT